MSDNAISVVIITKNEERRLPACLKALRPHFSDLWVVDSLSKDKTREIARSFGARIVDFDWNGRYPKKYGWCLDHLDSLASWVLFIDADEIMNDALACEIKALDLQCAGYFIKARYRVDGHVLKFGLKNNKLCLLNRSKMKFPKVNDMDVAEMGEIEGHYQPVLKAGFEAEHIGSLNNFLVHDTDIDGQNWREKHQRYARWEVIMTNRKTWPRESTIGRSILKFVFRRLPFQAHIAFVHSYILKLGFLDGVLGYKLARSRYRYYRLIQAARRDFKNQ